MADFFHRKAAHLAVSPDGTPGKEGGIPAAGLIGDSCGTDSGDEERVANTAGEASSQGFLLGGYCGALALRGGSPPWPLSQQASGGAVAGGLGVAAGSPTLRAARGHGDVVAVLGRPRRRTGRAHSAALSLQPTTGGFAGMTALDAGVVAEHGSIPVSRC